MFAFRCMAARSCSLMRMLSFLFFISYSVSKSGCRASARRVAEGRARAFRDQSNAMLALSPKREYKSVALAFSVFPKQRQKEGNICSVGWFTRPCDTNGTQGVCVAQRPVFCALRSRSRARSFASVVLAKRTMQQCKGLPWEPCRAAFSIPFHRTPLQCCNLHPR